MKRSRDVDNENEGEVNTFILMDFEVVKSKKETKESSKGTEDELKSDKSKKAESNEEKAKGSRKKMLGKKRARKERQQESSKRQRMKDVTKIDEHEEVEEIDEAELKKNLVIVKDDEIAIELILNGNKVLKRNVGDVEQEYEPTSTEENQDRRNKMKARGTLLMALLNKDQLKFHSYKDVKLLMKAIEKSTNSNSNISTNDANNTTYRVSAAHTQSNTTSRDNLSDVVICAFLASQPNSHQLA
ncbi:hypothetical protein Tco_0648801 [Tanacetum coccineum]